MQTETHFEQLQTHRKWYIDLHVEHSIRQTDRRLYLDLEHSIPWSAILYKLSMTLYKHKIASMSSKERQAKRRLKIKQNSEAYQAYLEKDKERKQAKRSATKNAMSLSQLEEHQKEMQSTKRRLPATNSDSLSLHTS